MNVTDVMHVLEKYAPKTLQEDFDNVGLLVGEKNAEVKTVLLTLDVDMDVAVEAKAVGAEMIISHHPLIFNPIKAITDETPEGRCLLYLIQNHIAVYAAHTNLDSAAGGLNDLAAQFLNLSNTKPITGMEGAGLGRIGNLPEEMTVGDLADKIKKIYRLPYIRFSGKADTPVVRVALCTGSGGSLLPDVLAAGADVYITGDVKYEVARSAAAWGLPIIELGHYESEYIVVDLLEKILTNFGNMPLCIYKSKTNKNVFMNIR